jgi:hypothetical protein
VPSSARWPLSLLTMTPVVKLSRPAFFCLALMLLVFAVWALAGFGYPSAPFPIAMNTVSKILAFVTTLSLFFPEWFTRWWRTRPDRGIEQAPGASELQPNAVVIGQRARGGCPAEMRLIQERPPGAVVRAWCPKRSEEDVLWLRVAAAAG